MTNDKEIYTIVGGGFGLYGYLPALINSKIRRILLYEKYKKIIETRLELKQYLDRIEWRCSINEAINEATTAIIAIPPRDQKELITNTLLSSNIKSLIIEKPISTDPVSSKQILNDILAKKKILRVGYIFLYTDWYKSLKESLDYSVDKIRINWSFKAEHFKRNKETWKKYHSIGGGPLRFYGIHLLAVLSSLGYNKCERSDFNLIGGDQPVEWIAKFTGVNLPRCELVVLINTDNERFHIEMIKSKDEVSNLVLQNSPFKNSTLIEKQDLRVPILERLIESLRDNDDNYIKLYQSTNALWDLVEKNH